MGWMKASKLNLNPNKMERLLDGSGLVLGRSCTLMPNEVALIPRAFVHSLGILLDPEPPLDKQLAAVTRNVYCPLWMEHQLQNPWGNKQDLATVLMP